MPDARQRAGCNRRRKRRREDEARSKRPDGVTASTAGGNVAAHHPEALGQRPVDDIHAIHDAVALGDATSARTVHAHGMNLIEIGDRPVLLGKSADLTDRRNRAIHRVDALERNDLRRLERNPAELLLEMDEIVVLENSLRASAVANAGYHRCVVLLIGKDDTAR